MFARRSWLLALIALLAIQRPARAINLSAAERALAARGLAAIWMEMGSNPNAQDWTSDLRLKQASEKFHDQSTFLRWLARLALAPTPTAAASWAHRAIAVDTARVTASNAVRYLSDDGQYAAKLDRGTLVVSYTAQARAADTLKRRIQEHIGKYTHWPDQAITVVLAAPQKTRIRP